MRRRIIYITVTAAISICLVLLGVFVFGNSYLRLFEGFKDFGTSLAFYFVKLFDLPYDITPTVTKYSGIIPDNPKIPSTPTEAGISAKEYFDVFLSADNFRSWGIDTAHFLSMAALIVLPCVLLIILLIRFMYGRCNTNHNRDTLPLRAFKLVSRTVYQPTYNAVSGYVHFLQRHRWITRLWLVVAALHLNLITILVEFFAFYFYFAVSIDITTIFTQIRKLFLDLGTFLKVFNVWGGIVDVLWLF